MSTPSLRVMTYNTHHGAGPGGSTAADGAETTPDVERIAQIINSADVDIVALQEVDRFWDRSGGTDQPMQYGRMLHRDHRFGANLTHGPDEHADQDHEYGVATLSRLPISGHHHQLLPVLEGWEQRGFLDTRIVLPGGAEISVINTHLQSDTNGDAVLSARQREEQGRAIVEYVRSVGVPVIVMGDLNTENAAGEIDALVGADSILTDVWSAVGAGPGLTYRGGEHGEPSARIDYILVSSHFRVMSARVIDYHLTRLASDHLPLVAELEIQNSP